MLKYLKVRKKLLYKNSIYDFKNTILYEVIKDNEIFAQLKVESTFTVELFFDSKIFNIQAEGKFFNVKNFKIIEDNVQIGKIKFWGWTWNWPKIILSKNNKEETWEFDSNKPSIFQSRSDHIKTSLKKHNEIINYEIKLLNFFSPDTRNECLREVDGEISFTGPNEFIAILGVYLNELLIFDEMDK